jgi:hypothetical protein
MFDNNTNRIYISRAIPCMSLSVVWLLPVVIWPKSSPMIFYSFETSKEHMIEGGMHVQTNIRSRWGQSDEQKPDNPASTWWTYVRYISYKKTDNNHLHDGTKGGWYCWQGTPLDENDVSVVGPSVSSLQINKSGVFCCQVSRYQTRSAWTDWVLLQRR